MGIMSRRMAKVSGEQDASHLRPATLALALEPRFMFDAAGAATGSDAADQTAEQSDSTHDPAAASAEDAANEAAESAALAAASAELAGRDPLPDESANGPDPSPAAPGSETEDASPAIAAARLAEAGPATQVVIIDSRVEDAQTLIDGAAPDADVYVLDAGSSAVDQITRILAHYDNLDALHLISHGGEGKVYLGNETLSSDTLDQHAEDLAAWGDALSEDGDILFYGCLVAHGEGERLIKEMVDISRADIAASTDLTGASALGGDWDLEYEIGSVEQKVAFDRQAQNSYLQVLGKFTFDSHDNSKDLGRSVSSTTDDVSLEISISGWESGYPGNMEFVKGYATTRYGVAETGFTFSKEVDVTSIDIRWIGSGGSTESPFEWSIVPSSGDAIKIKPVDHQWDTVTLNFSGITSFTIVDDDASTTYHRFGFDNLVFNAPPIIAPGGGEQNVAISSTENDTTVTTVTATDPESSAIACSLGGGADQAFFSVDENSGVLTFKEPPDFENPQDDGADNTYEVTVHASDGALIAAQTVLVTVTDANDAPVAVNDTGAATEAGGTANGTAGSNATGSVLANDTDVDAGATRTVSAVRAGSTEGSGTAGTVGSGLAGSFGTLTLNADGGYTYVVDDANATVQALAAGATIIDSFNYTVTDQGGLTDVAVLTITVTGANDAPVAVADTGAATEAGGTANGTAGTNATGSVLANDTDVDAGATRTVSAVRAGSTEGSGTAGTVGSGLAGSFGTLTLNADGGYTYLVDDANATVQALAAGATITDSFNYTVTDQSGLTDVAVLTITVTGANDAPVASNDTGSAVEAGGTANGSAGSNATGTVLANDSDADAGTGLVITGVRTGATAGAGTAGTVGQGLTGSFGALALNADGTYTYTVSNTSAAVQALTAGQTVTDSFNYTVSDGQGGTDTAVLTITVTGANDAPVAAGPLASQSAQEGQAFSATLPAGLFTDPDTGDALTLSIQSAGGGAGPAWLSLGANGTLSGTPGPGDVGTQSLLLVATDASGSTANLAFTVTVTAAPSTTTANAPTPPPPTSTTTTAPPPPTPTPPPAPTAPPAPIISPAVQTLGNGGPQTGGLPIPAGLIISPAVQGLGTIGNSAGGNTGGGSGGFGTSGPATTITVTPTPAPGPATGPTGPATSASGTGAGTGAPGNGAPSAAAEGGAPAPGPAGDGAGSPSATPGTLATPATPGAPGAAASGGGGPAAAGGGGEPSAGPTGAPAGPTGGGTIGIVATGIGTGTGGPGGAALFAAQPIPNVQAAPGQALSFQVPAGSFQHTDANASTSIQVDQADGNALPSWLQFDPTSGTFTGEPPAGTTGVIEVRVTVTDTEGRSAQQVFEVDVGGPQQDTRLETGERYAGLVDGAAGEGDAGDPGGQLRLVASADGDGGGEADPVPAGKPSLTAQLKSGGSQGIAAEIAALINGLLEWADLDKAA